MYNNDNKNNKNNTNKGGKVMASGAFGCVFTPALKCEDARRREKHKISKLMIERYALQEYEEINKIKKLLENIPNYENYFLIYDVSICRPSKLTTRDLQNFKKCTALPKKNITKKNVNKSLNEVMSLNIPYGGLPVDDYLYESGSFQKIYDVHVVLVKLLKNGIIPMNNNNVYHCDIKDANILVDVSSRNNEIKTRLIDWGLSTQYVPFQNATFPSTWRNRPLQYNVPFSVVLFTDAFIEKYTKYLEKGEKENEKQLKSFVIDYVKFWMDERGPGHYKYINEIMYMLFAHELSDISENDKPHVIETQITMEYIVDYIVDVLLHYTKFKTDGSLDLRQYLDNVFIKIVDIWGFIVTYVPIIEVLSNSYNSLTNHELKIFKQLQFIFVEYLYKPRHEPIDIDTLFSDLKDLGNIIHIKMTGKKPISSPKSITITKKHSMSASAKGLHKKTRVSFKRGPKKRRFKYPYFLSLKTKNK
jgi:serine/threonine protein kinase